MIKKIISFSRRHAEIIIGFFGGIGIHTIVNYIYSIVYKRSCEKFYNIPGRYFESDIDNKILHIFMLSLFLFLGFCLLYRNYTLIKKEVSLRERIIHLGYFSIIYGILLLNVNYNSIPYILSNYDIPLLWENTSNFFFIFIFFISQYSVAYIIFAFMNYKNRTIRKKFIFILDMIGLIVSAISISILLIGNISILQSTVENKLDYETVLINNEDKAIISIYDNNQYLIVEYSVDNAGNAIFHTDNYMLISNESIPVTYRTFSSITVKN